MLSARRDLRQPSRLTLTLAGIVTASCCSCIGDADRLVAGAVEMRAWKEAVAAVVALPLVLPPTVLGFYLLIALGPNGPGGALAALWGARTLAFSFEGLVIGSVIYSLPFMVQPLRNAFEAIGDEPLEAARDAGRRAWQTLLCAWRVPLARAGYLTGAVLTFAHTVGEFGVVLMIGGNIPGKTKVLSIAIYDYVERLEWGSAHILALGMVALRS